MGSSTDSDGATRDAAATGASRTVAPRPEPSPDVDTDVAPAPGGGPDPEDVGAPVVEEPSTVSDGAPVVVEESSTGDDGAPATREIDEVRVTAAPAADEKAEPAADAPEVVAPRRAPETAIEALSASQLAAVVAGLSASLTMHAPARTEPESAVERATTGSLDSGAPVDPEAAAESATGAAAEVAVTATAPELASDAGRGVTAVDGPQAVEAPVEPGTRSDTAPPTADPDVRGAAQPEPDAEPAVPPDDESEPESERATGPEPTPETEAEPVPVVPPVPAPSPARRPLADVTATSVTPPVSVAPPVRTSILDAVALAVVVDKSPVPPTVSSASPVPPVVPAVRPTTPPTSGAQWPTTAPPTSPQPSTVPPTPTPTPTPTPSVAAPAPASTPPSAPLSASSRPASTGLRPAGGDATAELLAQTEPALPGSPLDVFESDDRPRRWPRVLAIGASVVVVLGAAYVGTCYAFADKVARGASVAGIEIGGLGRDDAVSTLEDGLAAVTSEPITVRAGDVSGSIDPATAGLTFDAEDTVSQLTGVDLRPSRLWELAFGVGAQPAVTHVDDVALEAAVDGLDASLAVAPVDGAIVFADGEPHATAAVDGAQLDATSAADTLSDQWLTAARPLELATEPVEPDITQAETDLAMTSVATPFTAAPVTVEVGGQLVELPVATLTELASFVPEASKLVLQLDGAKLVDAVLVRTTNLLTPSADAHFEFVDGSPVIVPGTPGTTLDPTGLASAVAAAAVAPVRTATVELVAADPAQSTQKLEALGVTTNVAEFSTPLTSEPRRTANIANGARNVNGTVVLPGATFSLTEALGPVTTANGYQDAGVLVNGEHVDGMGGGLSQMATTTYNAGYFAGYEDIEHRPHTEWFSRYPEGRESTIYTGVLDMRWKNNTPYGALIQAYIADGRLWVRIWSTPYWTVEASTSARSDVVQPTTVYSQSPTCVNQAAGNPGFKVSVTRRLLLDGVLKDTKTDTWRYKASNKIVCGTAPVG